MAGLLSPLARLERECPSVGGNPARTDIRQCNGLHKSLPPRCAAPGPSGDGRRGRFSGNVRAAPFTLLGCLPVVHTSKFMRSSFCSTPSPMLYGNILVRRSDSRLPCAGWGRGEETRGHHSYSDWGERGGGGHKAVPAVWRKGGHAKGEGFRTGNAIGMSMVGQEPSLKIKEGPPRAVCGRHSIGAGRRGVTPLTLLSPHNSQIWDTRQQGIACKKYCYSCAPPSLYRPPPSLPPHTP